ncbi:MAG: glycoside hydrolase family 3 protein [Spirochaetaceae bacterium]|nr:MAG: glycoside hydrolase family 3 protein [Spirochaetaceae bacterium]
MTARNRCFALVAALVVVAGVDSRALSFWDDTPDDTLIEQLLDEMTREELLGQTLMLGWAGEDPSGEIMRWLRTTNIGGAKVFGWNGLNLVRLASAIGTMQRAASQHRLGIPILTATDQEGGWVRHVKGSGDLVTSVTPGNMAIGASGLPTDAFWSAYYIGMELRALGINMNLAPTIDVYINPEAHVIGPRAFSSDAVQTGILGTAFFHGLERTRVIATAKHFPGHGNASGDSHGMLPVLGDTIEELYARDLVPYRMLINEGVPAVLSGHLSFPDISGDARPASLSAFFKQQLLRKDMGFRGLIVTDDLYMEGAWVYGARERWGIEQIVIEALRAGNDMVMLSRTPDPGGSVWRAMLGEYDRDPVFRERIRDAARNVLAIKMRYLKPDDRVPLEPDTDAIRSYVASSDGAAFFRDQAARSVTIVADARLPVDPRSAGRTLLVGKDRDFLAIGREFFAGADTLRIESTRFDVASAADRARFRAALSRYDTVIFCLSDPNTMQVLREAETFDVNLVVLSILTPVYLFELPWIDSAVAVYGWGVESFRAGFSAMTGRIDATGRFPVAAPRR